MDYYDNKRVIIIIRDFILSDKEDFLRFAKGLYSSGATCHPVPDSHFEMTFNMIISKDLIVRGLMIVCDNKNVGYCQLSFTHSTEAGGMVVWIEELFIDENYRCRGLGSELFEFLNSEYGNTAARLRLEVAKENEGAIKLYKRLGFEELPYIQLIKE